MAIAPVLKTGVRKDLGVRIPRPPLDSRPRSLGAVVVLAGAGEKVSMIAALFSAMGLLIGSDGEADRCSADRAARSADLHQ